MGRGWIARVSGFAAVYSRYPGDCAHGRSITDKAACLASQMPQLFHCFIKVHYVGEGTTTKT